MKHKLSPNRLRDGSLEKTCIHCDAAFTAARASAKYCSRACRQAAYAGRKPADRTRVCLVCGRAIGHRRGDAIYCDDQCRSIGGRMVREAMATLQANERRASEEWQPVAHWDYFNEYVDRIAGRSPRDDDM